MHKFLEFAIAVAAGGVVTSFIEYKLDYNLVDLIVDKIKGLFGAKKA